MLAPILVAPQWVYTRFNTIYKKSLRARRERLLSHEF
jgi:hypothetical protein